MDYQDIFAFVEARQTAYLDELLEFLRIPSVSTDPEHAADIHRAARWLSQQLEQLEHKVRLIETAGHPVVYGERLADPSLPTLLIYGHYDVQPADPFASGLRLCSGRH